MAVTINNSNTVKARRRRAAIFRFAHVVILRRKVEVGKRFIRLKLLVWVGRFYESLRNSTRSVQSGAAPTLPST